jgi:hypothetical protein
MYGVWYAKLIERNSVTGALYLGLLLTCDRHARVMRCKAGYVVCETLTGGTVDKVSYSQIDAIRGSRVVIGREMHCMVTIGCS